MALDALGLQNAKVLVVSQITGTAEYQPLSGKTQGPPGALAAIGDWVMREVVRPAAYIELTPGAPPIALEPYGRPQRDLRGVAAVVTVAAVGGAIWGLVKLGQWFERQAKRRR